VGVADILAHGVPVIHEEMSSMTVTQRLSIRDVAPEAYQAVLPLQKFASGGTVDAGLLHLIQIRASQLNHCAWCLDMHTEEARAGGMSKRKIDLIAAWEEAGDLFTEQEQAVLAFAEQVTLIASGVSDEVWTRVREHFTDAEVVQLLMAAAAINVWNRMNVTARTALPDRS